MPNDFYEAMFQDQDEIARKLGELNGEARAVNIFNIIQETNIPNIKTVIDIGSGIGSVLSHLLKIGVGERYYAIDISHSALMMVKERKDLINNVELCQYDGNLLPYRDKSFDIAILSHVVEHLVEPSKLLIEVSRIAKYIVIEVPLEDNLYTRLLVKHPHRDYRRIFGHVQWFNENNFRRLLHSEAGLSILNLQIVSVPSHIVYYKKSQKSKISARFFVASQFVLRKLLLKQYQKLFTEHGIALCTVKN